MAAFFFVLVAATFTSTTLYFRAEEQRRRAREEETQLRAVVDYQAAIPDRVVEDRLVLVGDAGGCCHPLTATGLSVCTRDALRLRDASMGSERAPGSDDY